MKEIPPVLTSLPLPQSSVRALTVIQISSVLNKSCHLYLTDTEELISSHEAVFSKSLHDSGTDVSLFFKKN